MKERTNISSYDGLQEEVRRLKTPAIEVWANQYADRDYKITMDVPEFTCLCPKTGLPDFAVLHIEYIPHKWCIELKSFKHYILFYRQLGIFHENVVNRILDDLINACAPRWISVVGEFNVRGGIKTTVNVEYRWRNESYEQGHSRRCLNYIKDPA